MPAEPRHSLLRISTGVIAPNHFFIGSSIATVRLVLCMAQLTPARVGAARSACPRAIGGITTCHKMRHSLSLPTVTYICMGELPHFQHGSTTSFLHSQPIQTPPSGPGLICAAGQVFIWDDLSVTPLSWSFTEGVPLLYPQCGTSILFWGVKCVYVESRKLFLGGRLCLAERWPWSACVSRVIFLETAIGVCEEGLSPPVHISTIRGWLPQIVPH